MRGLAPKLALLVAVVAAFLWYRQHKNVQFSRELDKVRAPLVSLPLEHQPVVHKYEGSGTPLWNDRPYATETTIRRLVGLSFVFGGRNDDRPYMLNAEENSRIFSMATQEQLGLMKGWRQVQEPALVKDVYAPRTMDVLLYRDVKKGDLLLIQPFIGGPTQPVFFDTTSVQLVN